MKKKLPDTLFERNIVLLYRNIYILCLFEFIMGRIDWDKTRRFVERVSVLYDVGSISYLNKTGRRSLTRYEESLSENSRARDIGREQ